MLLQSPHHFGSADSIDTDVVYVVEALPSLPECKALCRSDVENRNLIVLRDGYVLDCFKGSPDEMNNALFYTHGLHEQTQPNPIRGPIERVVPLKVVRATRTILSHLTRSPRRAEIKAALRSLSQRERLRVLADLPLAEHAKTLEQRKSIAFQLGQALSLIEGRELYTKGAVAELYPDLAPLLRREPVDAAGARALDDARDRLLSAVDEVYTRADGALNLFCYKNSVTVTDWNPFCAQSRGLVIDMARERCVCFPYAKFFKLGEVAGWRREDLPSPEPDEIVEKIDGSFVSGFLHEGVVRFACKGNFDVEQARVAATLAARYDLSTLDFERYYFTFEVVYPKNRFPTGFASVDYGASALFLTGARDRLSHQLLPYVEVAQMAAQAGLRSPAPLEAPIAEVLARIDDDAWHNHEGWVAQFGGHRVKLKRASYLRVNDILNGLKHGNSRVLKRYLRSSEAEWRAYIDVLPEEFMPAVQAEVSFYERHRDDLLAQVDALIEAHHDPTSPRPFIDLVMGQINITYHRIIFRRMRAQDSDLLLRALLFRALFDEGCKREVIDWRLWCDITTEE